MSGKLYLIPNTLGECNPDAVIPSTVKEIVKQISYFIVEDERTVRRYISRLKLGRPVNELQFVPLNEHTPEVELKGLIQPIIDGVDAGLVSEAGVPGVADPGGNLIRMAHQLGIVVIPLVGPSSILLALMASGLNGQNFAFAGYLPIKKQDRVKALRDLEKRVLMENQTQIFIEAPYRNQHLFDDILETCRQDYNLCIACDITLDTEYIATKTISEWKRQKLDINKRPCIFLLNK